MKRFLGALMTVLIVLNGCASISTSKEVYDNWTRPEGKGYWSYLGDHDECIKKAMRRTPGESSLYKVIPKDPGELASQGLDMALLTVLISPFMAGFAIYDGASRVEFDADGYKACMRDRGYAPPAGGEPGTNMVELGGVDQKGEEGTR